MADLEPLRAQLAAVERVLKPKLLRPFLDENPRLLTLLVPRQPLLQRRFIPLARLQRRRAQLPLLLLDLPPPLVELLPRQLSIDLLAAPREFFELFLCLVLLLDRAVAGEARVQQMLLRCDVDAVRAEILRAELVELGLLVDPALPERQPLLVLEPEPVHRHLELLAQQILLLPTLRLGELVGDHLPAAVGVELAPVARGVRGARRDVDADRARIGAELRPVLLRQPPPARRLRPELRLRRCRQERRHRRAPAGRGGAVRARGAAPGRTLRRRHQHDAPVWRCWAADEGCRRRWSGPSAIGPRCRAAAALPRCHGRPRHPAVRVGLRPSGFGRHRGGQRPRWT